MDGNISDMGNDGSAENAGFSPDAFGYNLHYFRGDYQTVGKEAGQGVRPIYPDNFDKNELFNGNIGAMTTDLPQFGAQTLVYKYDQLQRLKSSRIAGQTNVFSTVSYDANGNIQTLKRANGDNYNYTYDATHINRLKNVAGLSTYTYDKIGNLLTSTEDGSQIEWNVYGKVTEVSKSGAKLWYRYDAAGNRAAKIVGDGNTFITTHYVRDATGNIMSTYKNTKADELNLYGSSRLGTKFLTAEEPGKLLLGLRKYELSNHLGNVLAVVSDRKFITAADVRSVSDYYPFGLEVSARSWQPEGYKFGFNGKEKDTDFGKGAIDFGARIYDSRIGRWQAVDPLAEKHPGMSPYATMNNNPILYRDPDGRDGRITITKEEINGKIHYTVRYETIMLVFGENIMGLDKAVVEKSMNGRIDEVITRTEEMGLNKFEMNGETYTFEYRVKYKVVETEKLNTHLIEERKKQANEKSGDKFLLHNRMPQELKEAAGYQSGDNFLSLHKGSRNSGPQAYGRGGALYFPDYLNHSLEHESFHVTGMLDLINAQHDMYNDQAENRYQYDILSYTKRQDIYIHSQHFKDLVKSYFKHFYNSENMGIGSKTEFIHSGRPVKPSYDNR